MGGLNGCTGRPIDRELLCQAPLDRQDPWPPVRGLSTSGKRANRSGNNRWCVLVASLLHVGEQRP